MSLEGLITWPVVASEHRLAGKDIMWFRSVHIIAPQLISITSTYNNH